MANVKGSLKATANGKDYTLHMGMSGLADLQEIHGQDVLSKLDPPEGAGPDWVPNIKIITDLVLIALQRHHGDEADKYLVDDLTSENADLFSDLVQAMFPDQKPQSGNVKRPKRAA